MLAPCLLGSHASGGAAREPVPAPVPVWSRNGARVGGMAASTARRKHGLRTPKKGAERSLRGSLICLGAILAVGCGGESAPEKGSPGGCIRAMLRYSRDGVVKDYLDCFTGELRQELEQARDQAGAKEFANLLRGRAEPVRGVAVSDETAVDDVTTRLKVEWVFEDRNEIQMFTLAKEGGTWRISDMTEAQYMKPEIPYGTEVF
jgi:hypothetical protein